MSIRAQSRRHPQFNGGRLCRIKALLPFLLLTLGVCPYPALSKGNRTAGPGDVFVCGTGYQRELDAIMRNRYHESLLRRRIRSGRLSLQESVATASLDQGNVAVLEADLAITAPPNFFDLRGKSFRFVPAASATYRIQPADTATITGAGVKLSLSDDDSNSIPLAPGFTFYGKTYSSVHVNSDGNLTFNQPDTATSERDLGRFSWGPPRIGPLFADLDPRSGSVFYRRDTDGVSFIWEDVPAYGAALGNTFSVKLFFTGTLEFSYGANISAPEAVVGISPGLDAPGIAAADFSSPATEALTGTIAEVFTPREVLSETAIARKFFQSHPDEFDQLIVFLGFPSSLPGNSFSYELSVSNEVQGIGLQLEDNSSDYGSRGRLKSFVMMGSLDGAGRFPSDPRIEFMRTYNSLQVVTHEVAHRWLAFPQLREAGINGISLLHAGDQAHWSFFFNADASLMEGNQILDLGEGLGNLRFKTSEVTNRFSELDRYLMGFIGAVDVSPMFYVKNPSGTFRTSDSLPSHAGTAFGGTRWNFTIGDIIAANGPRTPSVYQSQKVHRIAFVLVTKPGQAIEAPVAKMQNLHDAWVPYFNQLTGGQAWAATNLQRAADTTPAQINFPYLRGDSTRYTGFAVANLGAAAADVLFRFFSSSGNEIMAPAGIINPRMITLPPGGQIAMVGSEILGLSTADQQDGWVQAESSSSQVTGFFLAGDFQETFLDGAVAGTGTHTRLYFTRAHGGSGALKNLIDITNPNAVSAHLSLRLMNRSGQQQGAAIDRELPPHGRLAEDLSSLFSAAGPSFTGYIALTSDVGVVGFESLEGSSTVLSLPAQPPSTTDKLYSAQFASGPAGDIRYFTDLNLINTAAERRHVQITLIGNDGTPVRNITNPADYWFEAGSQMLLRGEAVFSLPSASSATKITEGTIVIKSDGPGMIGDVAFGDPLAGRFMAGLPLDGTPSDRIIFSHVAEGAQDVGKAYFTGVALHNPGQNAVNVTVDVYSQQGLRTGTNTFSMGPGTRLARVLPELVPGITRQMRGYIRVTASGGPIVAFELFGDSTLDFLAAVPPQVITP